ncbi:MAG: hypothetical protein ACI3ZI_08540, partial [Candidatus Cryptobacteroides sp.]
KSIRYFAYFPNSSTKIKKITEQILINGWRCASRWRFPGIPESVFLDFFDAEPLAADRAKDFCCA